MAGKLPILSCLDLATEEPTISPPLCREWKADRAKQSQSERSFKFEVSRVKQERSSNESSDVTLARKRLTASARSAVQNKANLQVPVGNGRPAVQNKANLPGNREQATGRRQEGAARPIV